MDGAAAVLLDGLTFPECPRWHEGALWFSDIHAHRIVRLTLDGASTTILRHDGLPAGLGWGRDGALLFVSQADRTLRCAVDGGIGTVADMSAQEPVSLNDMVVDAVGRAYIGGFGFDLNGGGSPVPACLYAVSPDGDVRVAANELMFPNGIVITPDGRTLIAAETVARRLTAFDIDSEGTLGNRRVWAQLDTFPDGICLDADGAVWVAGPVSGEAFRVREGGEVTDRVKPSEEGRGVYACMLGGEDGRTLFLCVAKTSLPELARGESTGWIETARVAVAGAGLP